MFEIGINTSNDCGKNFKEVCDNILNAGFKNVMLTFKYGEEIKQIKYAKKIGLNIPYIHLDYSLVNELWVKGEIHNKFIKIIKDEIDICSKYKIEVAVIHSVLGNPNCVVIDPSEFALNEYKKIIEYAESKNVKIALENMDNGSIKHFRFLLDNIKSPYLGFCYDVGHHNIYNKDLDLIELYGDRLLAVHLHDNLGDYQFGDDYSRDLHYLPFDGTVDYEKVAKKLIKAKYNNVLMLEVRKNTFGEPKIYKKISNQQFLKTAKKRAEKLSKLIKNNSKKLKNI